MDKEKVLTTFKRKSSQKVEYFEECYNILIEKFSGCNYYEFEEFIQYASEMAKLTSKPSNSFNAIRGVEYKPHYEN